MFTVFNQYPTFLVFLAVVFAMVVTMVLTPLWIKFLKSSHIGQQVRADGPESHLVKQGTPTMGGVIMLIAVIAVALFVGMPTPETFVLLAATVLTGLLGLVDDASKVVKERSLGLTPKAKIVGQVAIATAFVLVAVNWLGIQPTVEIPFVVTLDFGILTTVVPVGDGIAIPWLYLLFMNILLVGMCNAVNLTDGLDGLAAGTVMIVMIVMAPRSRARASGSSGSTRFRPTSSWATPDRSRWAWRWAAWPCSRRPSSCRSSSEACSWPRPCPS